MDSVKIRPIDGNFRQHTHTSARRTYQSSNRISFSGFLWRFSAFARNACGYSFRTCSNCLLLPIRKKVAESLMYGQNESWLASFDDDAIVLLSRSHARTVCSSNQSPSRSTGSNLLALVRTGSLGALPIVFRDSRPDPLQQFRRS